MGLLLAWLRAPHDHPDSFLARPSRGGGSKTLRQRHLDLARSKDDPAVSFQARTEARAWAATVPSLQPALQLERNVRAGEGTEPERLP